MPLVKVTKEQFFAVIGPRDVSVSTRGNYTNADYGSDFKTKHGDLVGQYGVEGVNWGAA